MVPHADKDTGWIKARLRELREKYPSKFAERPPQDEVDEDYARYRKLLWALDKRTGTHNEPIKVLDAWGFREQYDKKPKSRYRNRVRKRHRARAEREGRVERHDGKELDHTCGQQRKAGMKPCPLHYKKTVVRESACDHRKAEGARCVEAFPEPSEPEFWPVVAFAAAATAFAIAIS